MSLTGGIRVTTDVLAQLIGAQIIIRLQEMKLRASVVALDNQTAERLIAALQAYTKK